MRTADWNTSASVLERASRILAAFRRPEDRVLGVSELARRTDLPKSTVARLTTELARLQFLERHGAGYRLGLRLFELGQLAAAPKELRGAAVAIMADLRHATGQTVHLAVLEGVEVVYIEILRGKGAPDLPSRIGGRLPAHATAVGKAMLAFSSEDAIRRAIDQGLERLGPKTITDEQDLRRQLIRIKARGVAFESQESSADSSCAASPVLNAAGGVVAGLSVSGRVGLLDIRRVGTAVQTAALTLGRQMPGNADFYSR